MPNQNEIIKNEDSNFTNHAFECLSCGSIREFSILGKHHNIFDPRDDMYWDPDEYDGIEWISENLYIGECKNCKEVHLIEYKNNNLQEEYHQNYIEDIVNTHRSYKITSLIENLNYKIISFNTNKDVINYNVPEEIIKMSPKYNEILFQAMKAEQLGLNEIAGMGYRKALEFLVKDYVILNSTDEDKSNIVNMALGKLIDERIHHIKIQKAAKLSAWLGNDHTHYLSKHKDKDIIDLKALLNLVEKWISYELILEKYSNEMTPQ